MLDAHLVERQPAEVEAGAPEASGQRAGAITEKGDASASAFNLCHSFIYCRTRPDNEVPLPKTGSIGENSYRW